MLACVVLDCRVTGRPSSFIFMDVLIMISVRQTCLCDGIDVDQLVFVCLFFGICTKKTWQHCCLLDCMFHCTMAVI
jgi:hypothetical protein